MNKRRRISKLKYYENGYKEQEKYYLNVIEKA